MKNMGIRIIYGKAGTGKSEYCFKEVAKLIEKEKKIYIITPEQFSYTAEKKLLEAIGKKAVINAEVITLSRMAERILSEIGIKEKSLTKTGKAMLMYGILNENKAKLKFLGKSDENIKLGINIITELKKHGVTLEKIKEETENTEEKYLKTKLEDVKIIYENYENKIKDSYIEETDKLTLLSKNLEKTDFIKNSIIYIDEFSGFTYQEYEIIKNLAKLAKQVNITICTDELQNTKTPDTDIFYPNKITIESLLKLIKNENIEIENPVYLDKTYRFKNEELEHLEKNIYNIKPKKYTKEAKKIHMFIAKNQYTEIENVAKEINKLIKNNNLRYKDIAIITKNVSNYGNLTRAIFSKYEIPVFIDEKRELSQNIIVQYILSIFEILQKNFTRESIFNYLKLGFSEIDKDDIFKLENYCIKWDIKQNKWKKDFVYEKKDKPEEIEYFNKLRRKIIIPLTELKDKIQNEKTAKNMSIEIYNFMQSNQIEEKLSKKIEELEKENLIDLAKEYKESYETIIKILDEIVTIYNQQKITIDNFYQILKIGLKNSELGKIPGTQDQVIMGDVERSRSHKVDTIFIIGINDGAFPSINKNEGFFGDDDRNKLKEKGIELANGTIENLYEENFNIYKAFTTAENNLYLSYSSSDNEGKSLRPSILIHKIKKLYPNIQEESDVVQPKYMITNENATYEELLENIARYKEKEKIEDIWKEIYIYYSNSDKWKEKLNQDLKGLKYTNIPQNIDETIIEKLYGNNIKTSITKLEKYRSCPFSYYLQYGLNLKEKEELKIQSFDTGLFIHEIIDEFFKYIGNNKVEMSDLILDEKKLSEIVEKLMKNDLENGKNYLFKETYKYKVLVNRLKRILIKALKYIMESLVYSDFHIEGTEISFDKNGKYKPIAITLENGKRVEIIGKIDRIDTAKTESGNYLRIIDYKSSAKNIDLNEVYAGIQIQLLTYLDAVCEEEDLIPAGVLYFSFLEQIAKADKKLSEEEIEEKLRENFKMKGLILADVKVIQMQDNNLDNGGTSKIIPAGITKTGVINKRCTNGVESEKFAILQKYIKKTVKDISKEILKGKIDIKPYNKKGKTPCEYCAYKSICGFDTRLNGNKYKYIDKKSNDQVIKEMQKNL